MSAPTVLALSGGVGGAKLALGLMHTLPPENLTVVANTGDDFTHLGLRICPDIDTVVYTLSDLADKNRGWGRAGESWNFMAALGRIGGEDWFNLGDGDMAMHVFRTQALAEGRTLSDVTAEIAETLGIGPRILPMTDETVATVVESANGDLPFQHYFVRDRCEPAVTGFRFTGIADAKANAEMMTLINGSYLDSIVVTPSNPFVSIDPILSLPGVRDALNAQTSPIIAVSPIVGGQAIKGPAAKMMAELGRPTTALAVAEHYRDLIDGI
ncbi:MAG: 2-phospho-L-lactate transferase, partial [Pseudomonadota bacterium]|nr:2-phospho-L-lactate transferase [Pseudomonadota bacterium]